MCVVASAPCGLSDLLTPDFPTWPAPNNRRSARPRETRRCTSSRCWRGSPATTSTTDSIKRSFTLHFTTLVTGRSGRDSVHGPPTPRVCCQSIAAGERHKKPGLRLDVAWLRCNRLANVNPVHIAIHAGGYPLLLIQNQAFQHCRLG